LLREAINQQGGNCHINRDKNIGRFARGHKRFEILEEGFNIIH
jgi:hypothetical protein